MPINNIDDELWMNVARALGDDWQWTRDEHGMESSSGYLQANRQRLHVALDKDVWAICDALDLRIPELHARIRTVDLYKEASRHPTMMIGVAHSRNAGAIAQSIREWLLPGLEETLRRFDAFRRQRLDLVARRRVGVEALQGVCPQATVYWSDLREVPFVHVGNVVIGVLDLDDYVGSFDRSMAELALRTACRG